MSEKSKVIDNVLKILDDFEDQCRWHYIEAWGEFSEFVDKAKSEIKDLNDESK